jgi:hypothetical protein
MRLESGLKGHPLKGQAESGDTQLVCSFPGGTLVAVIDGLGHGAAAIEAAQLAVQTLKDKPGLGLPELFSSCNEALRKTRGVAMSMARILEEGPFLQWAGVGNVEGLFLRSDPGKKLARERLLLQGGVVGYQIPKPREAGFAVALGDTLILATDGIHREFSETPHWRSQSPQQMADEIMENFDARNDDALVWVGRLVGD